MKKKGETSRANWRDMNVVKCFLETCVQEVSLNGRFGSSLRPESWVKVYQALKNNHNIEVTQKQMKNHYDYLKDKYQAWLPISQKTGNVYNAVTNTINWTDAEWDEYIKGHPKAKTLKTSPLPFPDLCMTLFDGAAATGVHAWGPSSRYPKPVSSSSFSPTNVDSVEDNETSGQDNETSGQEGDNSIPLVSDSYSYASFHDVPEDRAKKSKCKVEHQRPKKKNKLSPLEEEMMKALKVIFKDDGPSVEVCVSKLDRLGWDETSSLYMAAQGIFCVGESYRRSWMGLGEDNIAKMKSWVKTIGKQLGFVVDDN